METKTRTEYSAKNTTAALISKIISILMGFVTRVVFTHTLSESYVGVNGLFSDILQVLALTELGVGTAITFALYAPIAKGNIERQKSLMKMYKNFYRLVAGIVLVIGLLVIPFMDVIIKNKPDVDHLVIIYLMYLSNSVLSYLFIYKKSLIDAHQLGYIGMVYQSAFYIIQDVIQIILLVTTHNFMLFLAVYIVCTIANNLCVSRKANKLYPYLKDKNVEPLPKDEKKNIYKNIRAMLMHKVGDVVINNTDNLLLSALVGIIAVGCYSNYYLVIGSIFQILEQLYLGITASVGNLGVTENAKRVKKIFEASFFAGQWITGFSAICLFEILTPFVELSFGKQYMFPVSVLLILCVNFYLKGVRQVSVTFRNSLGLFWFDRYKSIIEAVLNIGISVALALRFGTAGVFYGTLISFLLTSFWVEPFVLYKHCLNSKVGRYFCRYILYMLITAIGAFATHYACRMIVKTDSLWLSILLRAAVCVGVPNILFLLVYNRTWQFRFLVDKLVTLVKSKLKSRRAGE